jgi:hypothetical protein
VPIFVVEVGGRPVVAFNENLSREADAFVLSAPLRDNLLTRKRRGAPLWDGKAEIKVRDAATAERTVWQTSQAEAIKSGEADDEHETWAVWLAPVGDPTDDKLAKEIVRW